MRRAATVALLACVFLAAVAASAVPVTSASTAQPNIIVVLTDDQDLTLGGLTPVPRVRELIQDQGASLSNAFVSTPVCCPSRTTILSGRYPHNTFQGVGGCMHMNVTSSQFRDTTVSVWLQKLGYNVGLFGKYLNSHNVFCGDNAKPLPPGWDRFFALCSDAYFGTEYNDQGTLKKVGFKPSDYQTSVIGNTSIAWISEQLKADKGPVFAYIAPHAPHISDGVYPYITTEAPWYADAFANRTAPRTPNYDYHAADHHWLIAQQQPLDDGSKTWIDKLFRHRWRSLLSVDDLVADLVAELESLGQLNNTYILYTSDHGYNLGTFRVPSCKLQIYENDLRVPMLIRGPGISPNSTLPNVMGNVDIAPTVVGLAMAGRQAAGMPTDDLDTIFDGKSLAPVLLGKEPPKPWRDAFLVEYWSLGHVLRGAPGPNQHPCSPSEGDLCAAPASECGPCHAHLVDGTNNTYLGLRLVNTTHNLLYAEYYPNDAQVTFGAPVFHEFYDVKADPWQLENKYSSTSPSVLQEMRTRLHSQYGCKQSSCD